MRSSPSQRERTCTIDPPGIGAREMERQEVARQEIQVPFDLLLFCNGCDRTIGALTDGTVKKREYSTSQCPFEFLVMLRFGFGEQETLTLAALDETFIVRFVFAIFVVSSRFLELAWEREMANCQNRVLKALSSKISCASNYRLVRALCLLQNYKCE
jgi:hypothetical protein